jgi:hypothetical protein
LYTLATVKQRVRAIIGDLQVQWTTDTYLVPIINHVYELQILYLSDTCSPYIEKVAEVPNLTAGTTDLTPFQADVSQPLFGLFNPYQNGVDAKMAGLPNTYYRQGQRFDKLPDVNPLATNPLTQVGWEWRAWIMYITPTNQNIDLRVRGEFIPPPLLKDTDIVAVHPLLGPVLVEDSAACSMRERANPGQMQAYELGGTQGLNNVSNQLIRMQQGNTVRLEV